MVSIIYIITYSNVIKFSQYLHYPLFPIAPCGLGYYYNTDGREPKCDPCPLDTFQDEEGKDHCKPCRRGTFTLAQGSKSEDKCLGKLKPIQHHSMACMHT